MADNSILALIEAEIARLQQVRSLLATNGKAASKLTERKNKKAPVEVEAKVKTKAKSKKRRTLSPEARKRIGDAARKRWASQRSKG